MPTLYGYDCTRGKKNIGLEPCRVKRGKKTGHITVPKGSSWNFADVTVNKEFFLDLIQQGIARVIGNAFNVVTEVGDPTTETSVLMKEQVVSRSLPKVTSTLKEGYELHSPYYGMSGSGDYDIFEIYDSGIITFAVSTDRLSFGGLSAGMYEVYTWEAATDAATEQTRSVYQLDDLLQYNTLQGVFKGLDFNPNSDLNNIVDIAMTGRAVIGGSIFVKTPWFQNPLQGVSSFSKPNFRITVNGVADVISSPTVTRNPSTLEWEIEPTATLDANDAVVVYLTDATATPPVDVAKVGTGKPKFYEGQTDVITPVA